LNLQLRVALYSQSTLKQAGIGNVLQRKKRNWFLLSAISLGKQLNVGARSLGEATQRVTMSDISFGPIRVLVVDRKRLWSELLVEKLRQVAHFETLAMDATPDCFEAGLPLLKPNVILVALEGSDPSCPTFDMLRAAHDALPELKSVMLLSSTDPELMRAAFMAGATGVISPNDPVQVLIDCVYCVYRGRIWARNDQFSSFLELLDRNSVDREAISASIPEVLTQRQLDLVLCVSKGMTNREIAVRLHLSEHTVRNYLFRIFRKLGVSNRAALVCSTMHHGSELLSNDAAFRTA
jgi:two-component system nitrate/nitrite response regulator NarL